MPSPEPQQQTSLKAHDEGTAEKDPVSNNIIHHGGGPYCIVALPYKTIYQLYTLPS